MQKNLTERKETWKTIFLFLAIVILLTSPFHYAIVNLYPSRIYVGAIMWCPAIAAFITLKIKGRKISSLNWNWGNWKYIRLSYFIPALYGLITYILIWVFGFGSLTNGNAITDWGKELGLIGIGTLSPASIAIIAIILLGTIEVIRAAATTLGEEIGWRGFFIYELRKVLSFTSVSVFSGIIWAAWHWPLLVYYSNNVLLEFITFFIVIISMSFIMTYYAFKSKSLWPAVIFHAVSNVYIQKIMPELTIKNEIRILLSALILISSCQPSIEDTVDLSVQNWIHGSENCEDNIDPPIQIVKYNSNTYILRQSKCTNYEAPFMFLFFGENKALLMDTGATQEDDIFPLYETVNRIINDWSEKNGAVELIVAHTHKHGDHFAGDGQFKGKPNTAVIDLEVKDVQDFFKIANWPEEIVDYELGNRMMKTIPIPGHQASSIAVYDTSTKILLTGDTFYPGRLYINDWNAFKMSIERLVKFTDTYEVSTILGNHIEMTQTAGVDYPMGTIYQPKEHQLPLSVLTLKELSRALTKLGDTPTKKIHDSFIIYPVN